MQNRADKLKTWVERYHEANPGSRVTKPYRIERNGSIKRVYRSLIDGSEISMCAKYPITQRVLDWMNAQEDAAISEVESQK
jgi:hypothetical protein